MNDNKEIKALSDEELENIDGGKLSEGATFAAITSGLTLGTAALIGIPIAVAKAVDKKREKKFDEEAKNFDYDSLDYSKDPTLEDCNNNPKILAKARNRYFMEHKDEPGFTRDYTPWT